MVWVLGFLHTAHPVGGSQNVDLDVMLMHPHATIQSASQVREPVADTHIPTDERAHGPVRFGCWDFLLHGSPFERRLLHIAKTNHF